jgi:membrane protein required for colicin V production
MNWLDILLLVILVWCVFTSFRKGLTREIVGLASVVLALLLGIWFYGTAGSLVAPYVSSRGVANLAGFLIVFAAVLLAGALVNVILGKFLRVTGLSIADHALGAVFGLVRAALIAVALVMGIMAFSPEGRPPAAVVNSRLSPYVASASRVFAAAAPHELKEGFRRTYGEVRSAWRHAADGLRRTPEGEKGRDEGKL